MIGDRFWFLLLLLLTVYTSCLAASGEVSHDGRALIIDGHRRIILSGSIHYPRSTPEMWPDLIKKAKAGGLDAIETYVFWNAHERVRGQYDFSGNWDLIRFVKAVQEQGLYVVLRIGPYVCAEWNYGGLPVWLHNLARGELRTTNPVFMNEMQNFTTLIVEMLKQEKLFLSQGTGGPIILTQIENEYGSVESWYGDAGKAYVEWCAGMADALDTGVPWIMCVQSDAPQPMIDTCNGWYCDQFTPNNPTSPKMWTENWTGWFKNWGGPDPHRTAEDVAFSAARFFQSGGTFQNYYMYHGGTNFGRTAGGPYITTSYDYDAPLNEYGGLNQPKYGHLKELHDVLHSIESQLTMGNISTIHYGKAVTATTFALQNGSKSCFFGNAHPKSDATITYNGTEYHVPAWSVSILPDCQKEIYNTAKINTQTTLMAKKPTEPLGMKWKWRPEVIHDTISLGRGDVSSHQLLDQKAFNDSTDYLWYMTSVILQENDPILTKNVNLHAHGTGQVMHAYVNGRNVGSMWSTYGVSQSLLSNKVTLKKGKNQISLLSATVGLQNFGPRFDVWPDGIVGPVLIVGVDGDETIIKNLSTHKWTYKVGLQGVTDSGMLNKSPKWKSKDFPINRKMTWYKTTFKNPMGDEPLVVDLQGMGKGFAWVNNNNLGRYWPSYLAEEGSCSLEPCDYRGTYNYSKCVTNCGKPTQRFYHVPRSFLKEDGDTNELVMFEEFGGDPSMVNFRTVSPGTVCGSAYHHKYMHLSCEGSQISAIKFASFGDPRGNCGSFQKGTCESEKEALLVLQEACIGRKSCLVLASERVFGKTNCSTVTALKLVVEALC